MDGRDAETEMIDDQRFYGHDPLVFSKSRPTRPIGSTRMSKKLRIRTICHTCANEISYLEVYADA